MQNDIKSGKADPSEMIRELKKIKEETSKTTNSVMQSTNKIKNMLLENNIHAGQDAEYRSWQNSLNFIVIVISIFHSFSD